MKMILSLAWMIWVATVAAHDVNVSTIAGAAGAGWLHLEDWMFSWPLNQSSGLPPMDYPYVTVDTVRGTPQVRSLFVYCFLRRQKAFCFPCFAI